MSKISLPNSKQGDPSPLGASPKQGGVNFALYAPKVDGISLGIFKDGQATPLYEILLDPHLHFTDGIWHIWLDISPDPHLNYAYKIKGKWVFDPYAKELSSSKIWGKKARHLFGKIFHNASFDWKETPRPSHKLSELIIYEMHVRGFTQDPSSGVKNRGSFLGMIEKIPYLLDLGINAVELLPVYEFDETAHHHDPNLFNYWGYSPVSFFSLMGRYGTVTEFKEMVRAFHKAGIEVILDVVYNHVGRSPFDKIAKSTYFILDKKGHHTNYTGCGNTLNTNDPHLIELIVASLRYFYEEMHVDGFRFDLASIFCRGANGSILEHPPILKRLADDPAFRRVKFIVEPWDCSGLYQVGTFPGKRRFYHWNGQFRDHVRRFLRGSDASAGPFASAIAGSAHFHSISFITAHDGFTLHDLVSYKEKHNEANGEDNQDGNNANESDNCGEEGPTEDPEILALRKKQMKNFVMALFFSMGTPMMQMGDEYGHTRLGNNNAYCQDNRLNYFLWDELEKKEELYSFFKACIALRKSCSLFQNSYFLDDSSVTWHQPDWSHESRLVSYFLHDEKKTYFLAFNASPDWIDLQLPEPKNGKKWQRILDTALDPQVDMEIETHYSLAPNSSVLILG